MYKTREEFIRALGVEEMPEQFGARFDETMSEYERDGVWFLSDDYIERTQAALGVYRVKYEFVKNAAKRVRENDFLARYALLLYDMLLHRPEGEEIYLKKFPHGEGPTENTDYEMAAHFAKLAFAPEIAEYFRARKLPEDVIADTLNDCFEATIKICNDCFGRDGAHPRAFGWNQLFLNHKILRIGVLNFEMRPRFTSSVTVFQNKSGKTVILANDRDIAPNGQMAGSAGCAEVAYHAVIEETADYYEGHPADPVFAVFNEKTVRLDKRKWHVALSADDHVINVHIPSSVDLSVENTEAAYRRAAEIFAAYFPEFHPKAFVCFSWLMDPQLREMLKPTSKILAFQSKFQRFAYKDTGGMAVREFLFKKPVTRLEDWVEDTSLQRSVKAFYLSGHYIYAQGGIFFDYIQK